MSTAIPPVQRRRTERQLATAKDLRPRDIYDLHGIDPATLYRYATQIPEEKRPVSRLIRGIGKRKGIRLFPRAQFEAWLGCFDATGEFNAQAWAKIRAA